MMRALLWKDYRVNLYVLGLGAVLLFGPALGAQIINIWAHWEHGTALRPWGWILAYSTPMALAFSLITIAGLGGNAVASERANRSAEFLAYLPPSRGAIISSKAIVAVGAAAFIWGIGITLIYVVAPQLGPVEEGLTELRDRMLPPLASTSVLLFGAAWLGSSFLPTHTLATGFGIATPIALLCLLWAVEFFFELRGFDLGWWYRTLCIPLGITAFVAGVVCYVRRVEP
jgi:ABC-type transport system involved in multi-copper enzyme maturation permease subunit